MWYRPVNLLLLPLVITAGPLLLGKGQDPAQEPIPDFPFNGGKGGEMLWQALKPRLEPAPWQAVEGLTPDPMEELAPDDLLEPAPISPAVLELPRTSLKLTTTLHGRPTPIAGEMLPVPGSRPPIPIDPPLWALDDRIRVEGLDTAKSLHLDYLAGPVPDRASLDDPTQEEGVLPPVPLLIEERKEGISLGRLGIPDPFENHGSVQLPIVLPELPIPPIRPNR